MKLTKSQLKEMIREIMTEVNESGILYKAGVKKYGKEGMRKIQQAAGKRKSHAAIGAIKDKYEKGKKKDEGKLTEKPLKTNPKIWVSDKFDKVIDKLPYSKLTKNNVIKLAKKFKIDKDDALRWVSYNQDVDFGLKEQKLREGVKLGDVREELEYAFEWDYVEQEGADSVRFDWGRGRKSMWVHKNGKSSGEIPKDNYLKKAMKKLGIK